MTAEIILSRIFRLPRAQKRLLQVLADAVLISVSFVLAMFLRLDSFAFAGNGEVWVALAATFPVSILIFARLGFYRAVIRYIDTRAVSTILTGVAGSAAALFVISQAFGLPVPRSVPFIYALLAFCTVGGVRFTLRAMNRRNLVRRKQRVAIYGAGEAGRQLLVSLQQGTEYAPVAFIDDSPDLCGSLIGGLRVHGSRAVGHLIDTRGIEVILLAMPGESRARRARIIEELEPLPVQVRTVPRFADLSAGKAEIGDIGEVAIEDILGRDPVPPQADLMGANIRGKAVMVTGAGGSIGSELCAQILRQAPRRLVLFERSECALYAIDQELQAIARAEGLRTELVPLLGSVQDSHRAEATLKTFGIDTIYHAAAYKHVPLVEHNVVEGILNNVFGTLAMARAARHCGVGAFILVSTDKAVRPTNVMGATKRMAELICQALAATPGGTRFSMVRFGNVLGSSGSVIPLFRRQIEAGGPVTVTHPEITRFFMTIPEAAQLVIQAGAMAEGGDVFVLDMGQPVRIADLAARMVRLSGLKPAIVAPGRGAGAAPEGDIEIRFTGLRPGEKLYEELLVDEAARPTGHPKIMTASERFLPWPVLEPILRDLNTACARHDLPRIRELLQQAPTAYMPDIPAPRRPDTTRETAPAPLRAETPALAAG